MERLIQKLLGKTPTRVRNIIRILKCKYSNKLVDTLIFTNKPNTLEIVKSAFTVGNNRKCHLVLSQAIIPMPDNSVSTIIVKDYLSNFSSQEDLENFISNCKRLLIPDGKLKFPELRKPFNEKEIDQNIHIWDQAPNWCKSKKDLLHYLNGVLYETLGKYSYKSIINALHKDFYSYDSYYLPNKISMKPSKLNDQVNKNANVYLGMADPSTIIDELENKIRPHHLKRKKLVAVAGSGFYLNILDIFDPKELVVYDVNPLQINYTKIIVALLNSSKTREEFLSLLFSRPFNNNIKDFLSKKPDIKIIRKSKSICKNLKGYDKTIGTISKAKFIEHEGLSSLIIENNSYCEKLTISDSEEYNPGTDLNYWSLSKGFLSNRKSFNKVKKIMSSCKLITGSISDDKIIEEIDSANSVVYVTNIGEEDWLRGTLTNVNNEKQYLTKVSKLIPEAGENFRIAWLNEYRGFREFIDKVKTNPQIIDAKANIISMQTLRVTRSNSHQRLWNNLKHELSGIVKEIIHRQSGTWGFKEHLDTIYYLDYLEENVTTHADTLVLHLLLSNNLTPSAFMEVVGKASANAKKLIILEHYSLNSIDPYNLNSLLQILTRNRNIANSQIKISLVGSGKKDELSGIEATQCRNIIIVCDL